MSQPYVSLNDVLVGKNAWAKSSWWIADLLDNSPEMAQKLQTLEHFFGKAAEVHDDAGAAFMVEMIVACINDTELLPYVQKNKQGGSELPDDGYGKSDISEARYRATMARASKARELFAKVPSVRVSKNEYVRDSEGDGSYHDIDYATMPQTKEALLVEIANGWKESHDEKEAEDFFAFFFKHAELASERIPSDKESFRVRVFRRVNADWWDAPRLAHLLAEFGKQLGNDRDRRVMESFTLTWVKRAGSENITAAFRIMEPLLRPNYPKLSWRNGYTSPAAIEALRAYAAVLKPIDNMVLAMLESVGRQGVSFSYRIDLEAVEVNIAETARSQEDANVSFERWRDRIRTWLQANRGQISCAVRLSYVGEACSWRSDKFQVCRSAIL